VKVREELAKINPGDMRVKVELALALGKVGQASRVAELADEIEEIVNDRGLLLLTVEALQTAADQSKEATTANRCRDLAFLILHNLLRTDRLSRTELETDPNLAWARQDRRYPHLLRGKLPVSVIPILADQQGPYTNAQVGDFASYKMVYSFGEHTTRGTITHTITARDDKHITIKTTGTKNGMSIFPGGEQKIDLTKPFDPTSLSIPGWVTKVERQKLKTQTERIPFGGTEDSTMCETYRIKGTSFEADLKVWQIKARSIPYVKTEMSWVAGKSRVTTTLELTRIGNNKLPVKTKH
jgi:hypothetical protein